LEAEAPADPRAAWVLVSAAGKAGDGRTATETHAALDALLKEPAAPARLAEFEAGISRLPAGPHPQAG
jgi:hypothetical protein